MDHIGIDLGGRESQVCVRNGEGVILEEARRRDAGARSVVGDAIAGPGDRGDLHRGVSIGRHRAAARS